MEFTEDEYKTIQTARELFCFTYYSETYHHFRTSATYRLNDKIIILMVNERKNREFHFYLKNDKLYPYFPNMES